HTNNRSIIPARRTHTTTRSGKTYRLGGFPRTQIASKNTFFDEVYTLCLHTLIIESKGAKSSDSSRISYEIHDWRSVLEITEKIWSHERRPCKVDLLPQCTVQLTGMTARFMYL